MNFILIIQLTFLGFVYIVFVVWYIMRYLCVVIYLIHLKTVSCVISVADFVSATIPFISI